MKSTSVAFIGSGNLAWHLAAALDNTDYAVREVFSRNPLHAEQLVERLYEADVKATLDFSTSNCDIFILAVSDDALQDVVREIVLPEDCVLLHTSGSQPLEVLRYAATQKIGVLYPLQTFTRNVQVDLSEVPLFIESANPDTAEVLTAMARALSDNVVKITSPERLALHVAAVFASNFTNHMLFIAQEIMKEHSLSYDWLKPLIATMISKSLQVGPENAQTGPAKRGDFETLDRHMQLLQDDEPTAELYRVISQDIVDRYQTEEENL
jgi:predicted short-subunit dehydrogenase-like oxidoreductase (DUF2520 family)